MDPITAQKIRRTFMYAGSAVLIGAVTLYLALPVIALFFRTTPELFLLSLHNPDVIAALWMSLFTSTLSLGIVLLVGTPFAWVHCKCRYPGKMLVDTIIDLPLVLPPAVAGFALLMLYGRAGLFGSYLTIYGVSLAFTTLAVIMAQIFVASPFYLRQAKTLFEQLDPVYEQTARTLGASPFRTFLLVVIPLTASGLVSGAVMTFGRALGEFGATIMFAGNLPGVTQTMPVAVYVGMEGNLNSGLTIAILLVIISFTLMIIVRYLSRKDGGHV